MARTNRIRALFGSTVGGKQLLSASPILHHCLILRIMSKGLRVLLTVRNITAVSGASPTESPIGYLL